LVIDTCSLYHSESIALELNQEFLRKKDNSGIYPEIKFGFRSYEYSIADYVGSQGDGDGNGEANRDGRLGASGLGNLGPAVDYTRNNITIWPPMEVSDSNSKKAGLRA
jgi:hypothetical protein